MAKTKKTKGPQQKQRANVYTMMLIVAFLALSVGSFMLWKQLDKYEWDKEAKEGKTGMVTAVRMMA
ncbi:MAG: hypothetical protein K8T91_24285 [Planctomycetes bacterium]|nr:hypothetical protein [Planctomycetota bacterium]